MLNTNYLYNMSETIQIIYTIWVKQCKLFIQYEWNNTNYLYNMSETTNYLYNMSKTMQIIYTIWVK
jgi:hypothetical protein